MLYEKSPSRSASARAQRAAGRSGAAREEQVERAGDAETEQTRSIAEEVVDHPLRAVRRPRMATTASERREPECGQPAAQLARSARRVPSLTARTPSAKSARN